MPLYRSASGGVVTPALITGANVGGAQQFLRDEQVTYSITDTASAPNIGAVGRRELVYVGTAGATAPTGSTLGLESSMIVRNHSQAGSEQAPLYSVLRYDQGTGFANSGTPGRAWLTDFTVHGPIATQQQLLTGINLVFANYFNGQPSDSASCAVGLSAGNSNGGSLDATHAAATRYPNGVGLAIVGAVAGGTARGWEVGIQVGGGTSSAHGALAKLAGTGWGNATSKIGTGVLVRDHQVAGVNIGPRDTTGNSLVIETNAGPIAVGKVTGAPDSTVAMFMGTYAAPASNPTGQMFSFLTSDVKGADRGASIGLGGATDSPATLWRNFAVIAGRALNGTSTDSSGYFQVQVNKNGVGLQQVFKASIDGAITLFDGGSIDVGSTTGTKFGTATTQKMGWWNTTPVVRATGWAAATGTATRSTFATSTVTTAVLAEHVKALIDDLLSYGLIGA